ncbi:hypothetical protein OAV26_02755 [Crocinitomicaceae bacterium]|nr:hypothetical protein [Crocinitomicaceae bacterium]
MKKLFVLLFAGSLLASCGGSGYTTDKEDVISGYDDMKEDAQGHYDALLEIQTSWAEDQKEMLKDYDNKFTKLIEKAAKDDDAKGDLEDYRNREFKYEKAMLDQHVSWDEANWGLAKANDDQSNMLEKDEKKKFDEAIKKSTDAIGEILKAYDTKVEALKIVSDYIGNNRYEMDME